MVSKAEPFPKSIYENVATAAHSRRALDARIQEEVEKALRGAALWMKSGTDVEFGIVLSVVSSSVCASRGRWRRPEMLLFDEPLRRSIRLPRHASRTHCRAARAGHV